MSLGVFEANRNKRVVYMAKYFEKPSFETFSQVIALKYPCNFEGIGQKIMIFLVVVCLLVVFPIPPLLRLTRKELDFLQCLDIKDLKLHIFVFRAPPLGFGFCEQLFQ